MQLPTESCLAWLRERAAARSGAQVVRKGFARKVDRVGWFNRVLRWQHGEKLAVAQLDRGAGGRAWRYLVLASRLALLAAAWPGCDREPSDGQAPVVHSAGDIRTLEHELGVRFPQGTRLIGSHREAGMDDYLGVKVEMPRAALEAFLESSPVPMDRYAEGEGGLLGPDGRGYWDPHRQPMLRSGQAQLPGARALNIGYDASRNDVAVVYLVAHGT